MNIFLFHDRGEDPENLEPFVELLKKFLPDSRFIVPYLPHYNIGIKLVDSLQFILTRQYFPSNSVIVGVGIGGLLAAKFQEDYRKDITVIAIASPTHAEDIQLREKIDQRWAIFSSHDKQLVSSDNWEDFTTFVCQYTPLLFHDINVSKYNLAYIISQYLKGKEFVDHFVM